MPLSPPPNHTLASWNVECDGYPDYYRSGAPNTQPIRNTITLINPDTICFSDVFGWGDEQLRNQCLPSKFHGNSYFQPLEDQWLLDTEGAHMKDVGVAIATTAKHETPEIIDLAGRCGLKTILHLGTHGVRICAIYLNHALEDKRIEQAKALINILAADKNEDIPTIIVGDLNAQEALTRVGWREKSWSRLVQLGALAFNAIHHPYGPVLRDLERREALEVFEQNGFHNAATNEQRTALFPFARAFRVDHPYTKNLETSEYTTHSPTGSDHKPFSLKLHVS